MQRLVEGFHSHGGTPNSWLVYFMENPNLKWMMIWGYPQDSGNLQIFYKRISQHYQDCRHFCLGHRCQLGRRSRSTSGLWGSDFQLGEIPENDGMWGLELVGKMGDSRKNAQLTMEKWGISFWEGGDIIWMIRKKCTFD